MSKGDNAPDEPWLKTLRAGDADAAWDLFIAQYRRLIFAAIRYYMRDHDEVMDAFADVCGALRYDRLTRLQRYWERPTHTARFSSWLATVVRHQVIDWLRQHGLRRRHRLSDTLSPLQQHIFEYVFIQHRSHVETFELLRAGMEPTLSFGAFTRELRATYRVIDESRWTPVAREIGGPILLPVTDSLAAPDDITDLAVTLDSRLHITSALSSLDEDDRLALELFVVHEMPAAAVARALGLPNAKAVYNRVYRALAALRARLDGQGIRREDL